MKDKFKTKKGRLTPYALACGYIELKESEDQKRYVKLWHEGGCVYQVMKVDLRKFKYREWESFEKLSDARKMFDKFVKEINI